MKTHVQCLLLAIATIMAITTTYSQVAINADGINPDGSAMLDIQSTTKGFLVPRLTSEQKENISQPATGLLIYQTDGASGFYYNGGTSSLPDWAALSSSSTSVLWLRSPSDNATFLANEDDSVAIGKPVPTEKLDIQGNLDIDNFQPMILFREDSLEAGRIMHFGSPANGFLQVQAWDGNNFETTGLVVESPAQHVGVGTTNPAFKLDVAGTTRTAGFILSSTTGNGYILTSDENGVASWQLPASHLAGSGTPGYLAKFDDNDTLTNSIAFQDNNGNIGIGTNGPTEQLDVNGKLIMRDNIRMNGNWVSGDGSDEGLFVSGGGNVGVGTSTPASKLTSAGMIQTMAGGVKFPDNSIQTTAATQEATQFGGADQRWIIGLKIEALPGPYQFVDCENCFKVIGLDWYFNNTYDSITGNVISNNPQHHKFSILKNIDSSTVELIRRLHDPGNEFWMELYFYREPTVQGQPPLFHPYYKIHLEDVIITKIGQTSIYTGSDHFAHIDKVEFIYHQIVWEWLGPPTDIFGDFWGP